MLPVKYHTAPSRMRKRDTNVWDDLHALLDAADQPQHGLRQPHHAATLSGAPDALAARFAEGGSWSRQFKRRTSEEGNSMSLWEVGEALSVAACQPPAAADTAEDTAEAPATADFAMSDLDALQALVDAEVGDVMAQGADVDDTQRFVDSVFGDAAADSLPELTLMRTETTETNEDDLQDDLLLSMLHTDGAAWDLERKILLEGPEPPSPTSVNTLFGEALSDDGSPRADALAAARQPQGVFHAALTQRLEGCAERPAAPGATTLPTLSFPSTTQLSTTSRNGAERKEWTAAEDEIIHSSVLIHGCKWRRIAALLPGRSDDAVRNRWNRLKAEQGLPALPGEAPPPAAKRVASTSSDGASKPERVSWTKAEDATILRSVQELGHKWNKLAERLPGRTDHAIRNRFHRLQTMLEDKQRQQQRMLAPADPLPSLPLLLS